MQRERDTQTERQKEINVILPHGTDCSTVLGIQLPHLTLQDLIISMFSIFPMFRERERETLTERQKEINVILPGGTDCTTVLRIELSPLPSMKCNILPGGTDCSTVLVI